MFVLLSMMELFLLLSNVLWMHSTTWNMILSVKRQMEILQTTPILTSARKIGGKNQKSKLPSFHISLDILGYFKSSIIVCTCTFNQCVSQDSWWSIIIPDFQSSNSAIHRLKLPAVSYAPAEFYFLCNNTSRTAIPLWVDQTLVPYSLRNVSIYSFMDAKNNRRIKYIFSALNEFIHA